MADIDKLIDKVIEESGLDSEEVRERMDKKKEIMHGLLSDYGAIYAVAKELGVDLNQEELIITKISEITPQKSFNVLARVHEIYPPKEFPRKDGTTGKFASIILGDSTKNIRLTLWDENVKVAEVVNKNDTLLVKNAYGKDGKYGIELHAGSLTNISIKPKNMGLELPEVKENLIKINELKPDMDSVSFVCKVNTYYPPVEFQRSDGSTGTRASFIGEDKTGTIRVTLWESNAKFELSRGDTVKIENARTKENNKTNKTEVSAGNMSRMIKIDNLKEQGYDLPEIKENLIKINELKPDMDSVSLICRVNMYYPPVEFKRSDGNTGTRASFTAEDETGKTNVVLWDRSAKTKIARGDIVKIENAYAKEGMTGEVELQAGNKSLIMKSDKKLKLPKLPEIKELYKINEITTELKGFNSVARVLQVFEPREYGGSGGKLVSMIVGDETGTIRVVMWDEKSEIAASLKKGDAVKIKNAYAKKNLSEVPEISIGKYSEISITDEKVAPLEKIEKSMIEEKNISDLKDGDFNVKITGEITDIDETRRITFRTCPECKKKVQNLGGEWFCEACGDITPVENLVVSATVKDKTGDIKIVVFKENAEKILGMDVAEVMNIIGEEDEHAPVKQRKPQIIGKKVSLTGKVRFSDFSEQLEFVVDRLE